jgi:Lon-like protease
VLSRRRLLVLLVVVVAITAAAVGVMWLLPSNHYIVLPDRARAVDPLISVPGESRAVETAGIYMVDVRVGRASLFERLFPGVYEGSTLLPEHVLNPAGVPDRERRESSLQDMDRSQEIATTVALRALGRRVAVTPVGAQVVLVLPNAPADGELEVGDLIVRAQGEQVRTSDELVEAMADIEPGDPVTLRVRRESSARNVTLRTQAARDDPERAVVGIQVQDAADFRFPVDIEIDSGSIGGPSAGLAFALDIVDELGEDIDRGRTIVATGELSLEGEVAAIGGVPQKTLAARRAGADVFLVPDGNAAEARRHAEGLSIVAVSDFEEALSALTR